MDAPAAFAALRVIEPAPRAAVRAREPEDVTMRKLRDTLVGDIDRHVKLGRADNVRLWDPHKVFLPATVRPAFMECVPAQYEDAWARPPRGLEKPCRMGQVCQCNTLHRIRRDMGPDDCFIAAVFYTPRGQSFGTLCVLCLKLLAARTGTQYWESELPGFKVMNYWYVDGTIKFRNP